MPKAPSQAILLAAGLGTRLRPLTHQAPKPILPVGGLPILFYNLYLLREAGVREVMINLHHLPGRIQNLLKGSNRLGLKIRYSMEPKILGTAGGIAKALKRMERTSTLVLNGDIICDVDLRGLYRAHLKAKAEATLVCLPRDRARVESFVETDARSRIRRIAGGPPDGGKGMKLKKWIFSGVHLIEPRILKGFPQNTFGCIVRQVYQPALAGGKVLKAFLHRGDWWDLGSLQELTRVDRLIREDRAGRQILRLWREASAWAAPLLHDT